LKGKYQMTASDHASEWERYDLVQFRRISAIGALTAALFFIASLTPSLSPRDALVQGVASGLISGIGYEVGLGLVWIWRALQFSDPKPMRQRALRRACFVSAALILVVALANVGPWRNATRAVLDLPPLDETHVLAIAAIAVGVFALVWVLLRFFWLAVSRIDALVGRFTPPRLSLAFSILFGLSLFYVLIEGTAIRFAVQFADTALETTDQFIDPGYEQPSNDLHSGSVRSFVRWNGLGQMGRLFVATAPTISEIEAFRGSPALDPIRVYIGRRSAETSEERAELAVSELIRVGGFERKVLIVASPTGTGWMDPSAHDALDIMLGGDVATVAVQFSYLSSALALLMHPEKGLEQTEDLFDAVYNHWSDMPKNNRPKLYVFGLSQGAFNTQSTVPLLDMLSDPIDGALWVGSPFLSPIWKTVRDNRTIGSPAWRPRFGNGSLVRTLDQFEDVDENMADWGPIRLVFLRYASDPIVVFTTNSAFARPDWLLDKRASDVSQKLVWVPIVTMLQTALDMTIAIQVEGFGHYYAPIDYIRAWSELLTPVNWTPENSADLADFLHQRGTEQ